MLADVHVLDTDKGQRGTVGTDDLVLEIDNVLHHFNGGHYISALLLLTISTNNPILKMFISQLVLLTM
jgi:hypothetical protein